MHNVTVNRTDLLNKVSLNRDAHRKIFEEALEGYREQVIIELDGMLSDAKYGKRIRRQVSLVEPMDQTKEYDRVIAMLKMSVDEKIDLDANSFANYVLDQWSWTQQFSVSNLGYLKSK